MDSLLTKPVTSLLRPENHGQTLDILKALTCQSLESEFRSKISIEIFQKLNKILKSCIFDHCNCKSEPKPNTKEICIETLRILRNVCVNSELNQQRLYEDEFGTVKFLIETKIPDGDDFVEIKRFCLQLIGNSLVGNPGTCIKFVEDFDGLCFLNQLLSEEIDSKVLNYTGMIGLTITQQLNSKLLEHLTPELVNLILNCLEHEFVILWFESLCSLDQFVPNIYPNFSNSDAKVKFLHGIIDHKPCLENLSIPSVQYLITNFKSLADKILVTNASLIPEDLNPMEITLSVELFCKLIEFKGKFEGLKEDGSFVTSVIYLFRTIHELGTITSESGANCFTPIETLGTHDTEVPSEPWFLFKANLIRLIGGLVENHPRNQNRVRELECLSVLLNCTKIDSRNPFIPQCSIMTLKFLLENNSENQEYVKGLEKVGDCKLRF